MKGGGGGGEGGGRKKLDSVNKDFFFKCFQRTFLRTRLTVTSVAGIFCTFVFRVSIT